MNTSHYDKIYHLTYIIQADTITITEYDGDEARVIIPDTIEERPVTTIAPYALSKKQMHYLQLPAHLQKIDHHGCCECRNLVRVDFPEAMTTIGNYAFYNCLDLKAIHLTPFIRSIGFGAFMNCEHLTEIIQDKFEDKPLSLGSLLDELTHLIHVEMHHLQPDGSVQIAKVTFTEYIIEVVADAAAIASICKQFISEYTGSGRNLRFCVGIDGIDYKKYDQTFVKVLYMDDFHIAVKIAMDRLMYPYELSTDARQSYLDYVNSHASEAIVKYINEDNLPALQCICDLEIPDADITDEAIDLAASLGKSEFTALLMHYKRQHFSMSELSFDL